ncbi:MAG: OsmC family protein [Halodesulfurarchaeum sp.]|nr:OsmC family protein [Halodesulfurarchaeum sp.]
MARHKSKADETVSFSISAESRTETHTVVEARDFTFSVDEPTELGGTNAGPNPVEYLLGALAGCLNVVGHTVAAEMDIEMRNIDVEIEGDLDPRKFMGQSEDPRAGYQQVSVSLAVETEAEDDQLETWLETVEERCPVSDNIANSTPLSLAVDRR